MILRRSLWSISNDRKALIDAIQESETIDYNERYKVNDFREKFCALEDGHASQRVADEVICHLRSKIV